MHWVEPSSAVPGAACRCFAHVFHHGGTGEKFVMSKYGKHALAPGTRGLANGLGGRVLDTWWATMKMAGAARGHAIAS